MLLRSAWVAAWLSLAITTGARAQVCDEDAAMSCFDDAGTDDGGVVPSGMERDSGPETGPGGATCSCTSDYDTTDGYLHVCTGSLDEDTCAEFSCDQGRRTSTVCATRGARLCCDMPERNLYTQLYDDCTHPRCELGFRAQCEDFGGRVHLGPCDVPEEAESDDDDDGFCSALPGQRRGSLFSASLLLMAAVVFSRRRR